MKDNAIIFAFIAGCVVGLCAGIAVHDWSMAAHAGERAACKEHSDSAAYYVRKPGESHNAESCRYVAHYGDREWVPALGTPIITNAGIKGKPGLELQLTYVRAECRRLARQLKQKC